MKALVSGELSAFLWSCLCGVVIAMLYDLIKTTYKKEHFSLTVCNICDGLFVICACAIMIFVLFTVSNGYVRSYEFLGAFLGGILYKITLSLHISRLFSFIIDSFFAVFNFFLKILLTPLQFMYKIIYNTISVFFRSLCGFFHFSEKRT